jgi:PLP dependent protein
MIRENLQSITQRIARSCEKSGVSPDSVRLIAVTKEADIALIEEALACGVKEIGENRVQEALKKHAIIGDKAVWHLIGHLQTNKVKEAVKIFSLIHSVDSLKLAREIDKEAAKIGKVQDVLIQVNTSGEESKFGIKPVEAPALIKEIAALKNVRVMGLMTIAPEAVDPEAVRPYFSALKVSLGELNSLRITDDRLATLSMGMTNDFEIAIEEGANLVRIGRAIFSHDK